MINFILYGIVFYIVYKMLRTIMRLFMSPPKEKSSIRNYRMKETKYKDVEDADYTEIPGKKEEEQEESKEER